LDQILKILNPFMPYITETLYAEFHGDHALLMEQSWPVIDTNLQNADAYNEISWLQNVIGEIRSVRTDMNVPASAKLDVLVMGADNQKQSWINAHEQVIGKMARVNGFETITDMPKGAIQIVIGDMTLGLPVADIIDLDKERARLQKEIQKHEKDIKQIDGKLSNENFISKAPEDVIEEQKMRKSEAQIMIEKLSSALTQLDVA